MPGYRAQGDDGRYECAHEKDRNRPSSPRSYLSRHEKGPLTFSCSLYTCKVMRLDIYYVSKETKGVGHIKKSRCVNEISGFYYGKFSIANIKRRSLGG